MKDELGNRIKENYENRSRVYLPRRTNTILRIDGKAFHTFTRNCEKPFDAGLIEDMDNTAIALCEQIQGAKLAYVQSDEISVLVTDYDGLQTSAWFDGNVQKICSISASIATAEFNKLRISRLFRDSCLVSNRKIILQPDLEKFKLANFDSRCFTIPELNEVVNYFLWRTQDASRNSVQMVARSLYSHKECENKNNPQLQEMIFQKGINWNDYNPRYKRGRVILKKKIKDSKEIKGKTLGFERSAWQSCELSNYSFEYWKELIEKSLEK